MFDFGWGELVLIGMVALIAIGPKELPGALRTLGQWVAKVRRMASEFQNQFHEAMREAELAELKKEVDEMAAKAQSYAHFDPIEDIKKDLESAAGSPPELDAPPATRPDAAGHPAPAAAESAGMDVAAPAPSAPAATEATGDPAPARLAEDTASSAAAADIERAPGAVKPEAGRAA